MQWYYSKGGTQLGPVAESELISKLASGEVSTSDLVWKDGMADWIPAAQVPELKVPAVGAAVSLAKDAPPVSAVPPTPYAAPAAPLAPTADIPNYLWQSIVVTVLCCLPFGIVAIVNAAKVDSLKAQGNFEGAAAASAAAKKWAMISLIGWAVAIVLYFGFVAVMIAVGGAVPQ